MPATLDTPEPDISSARPHPAKAAPAAAVHVVPFSHLDLFWLGTREECLSRGNEIISRALDLLEKYPDFTYLIETVNFLDHYIQCYPSETERIRRFAASGRLELAPLWSAIYQNLPDGETLARNTLYAKRYVRRIFGVDPVTAHFADLPGYTPQYPQIAALSGIRNILLSRGAPPDTPLFYWQALDGTRTPTYYVVLGYAAFACGVDWHKDYPAMLSGETAKRLKTITQNLKHPAIVHWGCDLYTPDENLILNIRHWNRDAAQGKHTHQLHFSTFSKYFSETLAASPPPPPPPTQRRTPLHLAQCRKLLARHLARRHPLRKRPPDRRIPLHPLPPARLARLSAPRTGRRLALAPRCHGSQPEQPGR
ncbi:hypothetical protein Ga0100231_005190 [Opitutaceae bacterium TAV4]|nr:hypothetical protein Ga0100231_005190 [Opitutaceae bacterium TAV4]